MFTDIRHQNSHSQLLKGSDETAAQTVPGYFGAGRFPVEGILRAVRNPVDADRTSCGWSLEIPTTPSQWCTDTQPYICTKDEQSHHSDWGKESTGMTKSCLQLRTDTAEVLLENSIPLPLKCHIYLEDKQPLFPSAHRFDRHQQWLEHPFCCSDQQLLHSLSTLMQA